MRVIGMDIHRTFAEAVMIDGDRLMRLGRINMSRDHLAAFAAKLTSEDHIVIEATGNAHTVAEGGRTLCRPRGYCEPEAGASHRQSADQDGRHRCDRACPLIRQWFPA